MMTHRSVICSLLLVLSSPIDVSSEAGIFGAYPLHGGNHMKQQIALNSNINADNIHSLQRHCSFSENGVHGFSGYPIVDDAGSKSKTSCTYFVRS